MSSNGLAPEEGGQIPQHEVVLDVMNACDCTEVEALNLLQVSISTGEPRDMKYF